MKRLGIRIVSRLLAVACVCAAIPACSDDTTSTDGGVDLVVADQAVVDSAQADSAPGEGGPADAKTAETAATDGSQDSGSADVAALDVAVPDATVLEGGTTGVSITGKVSLSGVTCGSLATNDCKGQLVVVAFGTSGPPPGSAGLATTIINNADLTSGKSVAYTLSGLKASTVVFLAGFLVESGTISSPPWPGSGDPVNKKLLPAALPGSGSVTANITLDVRVP